MGYCQVVRRKILTLVFTGSNPVSPAMDPYFSWLEISAHNRAVLGSIPRGSTKSVFKYTVFFILIFRKFIRKDEENGVCNQKL